MHKRVNNLETTGAPVGTRLSQEKPQGVGLFFLLASFQIKKITKSKLRSKYGSENKFSDIHMAHTVFVSET